MNQRSMGRPSLTLSALAVSLLTACACAQPTGNHDRPPPPSPEALSACKTVASGEGCSFTAVPDTVSGTCWAPAGRPLACRPTNPPAGAPPRAGQSSKP